MWNKCSCAVVWTFFGIVLLWEVVLSTCDLFYLDVYYRKHFAKNISPKYWYVHHCFKWLPINPKNIIDLLPRNTSFLHNWHIKIFICSNQNLGSIILTLVGLRRLEIFLNVRSLLILSWIFKNKSCGQPRLLNIICDEKVQRCVVQLGIQSRRSFVFMEALVSDSTGGKVGMDMEEQPDIVILESIYYFPDTKCSTCINTLQYSINN